MATDCLVWVGHQHFQN